ACTKITSACRRITNAPQPTTVRPRTRALRQPSIIWRLYTRPATASIVTTSRPSFGAQAQRWAKVQDLHRSIDKVEADALYQDDLVEQLTDTGKGKSGAVVKLMNAMSTVGAIKFRIEAEKDRAEAARLRDELAATESQSASSAGAPAP